MLDKLPSRDVALPRPVGIEQVFLSIHRGPMVALVIQGEASRADLGKLVSRSFGCSLPEAPSVDGNTVEAVWAGADRWMLISTNHSRNAEVFSGGLSQSNCILLDQSSGWLLVTIRGPAAIATLTKGLQIDLDPSVFSPGSAALTSLDHIWTCVWRPKAESDAYRLLIRRSYSRAFRHWFEVSAIEFRFTISAD